jgi:hypothetical protein
MALLNLDESEQADAIYSPWATHTFNIFVTTYLPKNYLNDWNVHKIPLLKYIIKVYVKSILGYTFLTK